MDCYNHGMFDGRQGSGCSFRLHHLSAGSLKSAGRSRRRRKPGRLCGLSAQTTLKMGMEKLQSVRTGWVTCGTSGTERRRATSSSSQRNPRRQVEPEENYRAWLGKFGGGPQQSKTTMWMRTRRPGFSRYWENSRRAEFSSDNNKEPLEMQSIWVTRGWTMTLV